MIYVFMYRVPSDSGFAPCVDNGLLSLACCKGGQKNGTHTGIRYWIGKGECRSKYIEQQKFQSFNWAENQVYLLGIRKENYKNLPHYGKDTFLYIARITDVETMIDYFQHEGKMRTDGIYDVVDGKLVRNDFLMPDTHADTDQQERDKAGVYALLSDDYVYLGRDAVLLSSLKKLSKYVQDYKLFYRGQRILVGSDPDKNKELQELIEECYSLRDNKTHTPHNPENTKDG